MLLPTYDPAIVALSVLIAAFASYVALDLARRVHASPPALALAWGVGGALVMGSGIWAMHFVGMLAMSLPIALGYAALPTFASWAAAVAVSALALRIAAAERLRATALAGGALAMGAGICTMHYLGMAALQMAPGIRWNARWVLLSAVVAVGASALALLIFFGMRRLRAGSARLAQLAAALVLGLGISGMHYSGMAAAGFPEGSVCLSAGGLGGASLGLLVVIGSLLLLSVTLFTSVLDGRLQARTAELAQSLHQANARLQGANEELQRRAVVDPLTGVANRAALEDRLAHAAARVDRLNQTPGQRGGAHPGAKLALLLIDLDGFKPVNDTYGHGAGDEVLQQAADRLVRKARAGDTVARLGADEFMVLLESVADVTEAVAAAGRILQALGQPFGFGQRSVALSCSVGVVVYPDHGLRDRLMAHADAAKQAAKRAGGGTYAVFERRMHGAEQEGLLALQQALRQALPLQQLQLHYQPKIDSGGGRLRAVEALLRWNHPTLGAVSPAVFIPVAERFGLIVAIGNWVIDEACRQMAAWAQQGLRLQVSINISGYQLRQPEIAERIRDALQRHGVTPQHLVCEITESVAMENSDATRQVMERLTDIGVRLSIDDFGTGYSSLASLRQWRVHELKIDRSFVKDVHSNADARAVIDAVVRLAHALDLTVVAEGVETHEQRAALVALGCDELQGYYFARPMAPEDLSSEHRRQQDAGDPLRFPPPAAAGAAAAAPATADGTQAARA